MKKFIAFLLALTMIVSCFAFVACNNDDKDVELTAIKIKDGTLPETINQNDVVDYAAVKVVLTFSDGTTKEVSLTDSNVTYDKIDATTVGTKTFTVKYGKLTATKNIEVVEGEKEYSIASFELPDGYAAYITAKGEQTNKETEFFTKDVIYKVGSVNGFVCSYKAKAQDLEDLDKEPTLLDNVKTTYKLYLNDSATELSEQETVKYLSKVEGNVFYFTNEAVGKTFKLAITLDKEYKSLLTEAKRTIELQFEVVDGYNVYDAKGLSVLDNLDVNSWATIKEEKLAWDEQPLSEYTDVKQVVLHNNITVSKSDLPESYFWKTTDERPLIGGHSYSSALAEGTPSGLKNLLNGSLKETYLGEAWEAERKGIQRALYVSNGIGINGNYMKLGYKDGLEQTADGKLTAPDGGIYIVCDYNSKSDTKYNESHISFMAYQEYGIDTAKGNKLVENVNFVGTTAKTDNTDGVPAGLMMFQTEITTAKEDAEKYKVTLDNIVGRDWFCNVEINTGTYVDIANCKFYNSFSQMIFGWYANTVNVTNCEMKNSGGPLFIMTVKTADEEDEDKKNTETVLNIDSVENMESWLSGAEAWFDINLGQGSNTMATQMLTMPKIADNTAGSHFSKVDTTGIKSNAIAVLIPFAGDVLTNTSKIIGKINIGDTSYGMNDETFNAIISTPGAGLAPVYKSGAKDTSATLGQNLNYGYIAAMPDASAIIGGSAKLSNPTIQQVAAAVAANPTAFELPAEATQEQIMAVANGAWENSWKTNHTDTLGLYLNIGALTNQQLAHILLVFGEQKI